MATEILGVSYKANVEKLIHVYDLLSTMSRADKDDNGVYGPVGKSLQEALFALDRAIDILQDE